MYYWRIVANVFTENPPPALNGTTQLPVFYREAYYPNEPFDETIVARLYPTWILAPNVAISGAAALCKTDSTGELISTGPCFTFTLRFAK
jgi:hypothetical protein